MKFLCKGKYICEIIVNISSQTSAFFRKVMGKYNLGIDIGTTSVKVCIVNTETNEVDAQHIKETQSNIPSDTGPGGNKQDVTKIISALNLCVSKLPKQLLQEVNLFLRVHRYILKTVGIAE